ncbi:MAG: dipeptidase [Chloroflexia bacterium]|nr:dipeptidase [Chloroflexia bacterium]
MTADEHLEAREAVSLDELEALLRIPSISALPEHDEDVRRAAEWVADRLRVAGMDFARVVPTGGHPVVYAEWLHRAEGPTILIYGHLDVQPVDPINLWDSSPFEPEVRDDRMYARGASDMKGNLLECILGVEALLRTEGSLPVNLKFLIEGQEEIGSPQLPEFVAVNQELLACDLVVSADGGQWSEEQPQITLGLRGLAGLQIDVYGPATDVHSGIYGGTVANPIHALAYILDSMRTEDGRITVDGFHDGVKPVSDEERAAIARVPLDTSEYAQSVGVEQLSGEEGYTPLERVWVRPTLEVNGIWGGFQGEGSKTVLPSEAHAKITCRLVPDQDPARILEVIAAHVEQHTPSGIRAETRPLPGSGAAYLIPHDHWGNRAAADVLSELYGVQPYLTRSGGTVPVCAIFQRELDAFTVSFGFGLDDERIHAPNEFLRLRSFRRGQIGWVRLLRRLGQEPTPDRRRGVSSLDTDTRAAL